MRRDGDLAASAEALLTAMPKGDGAWCGDVLEASP